MFIPDPAIIAATRPFALARHALLRSATTGSMTKTSP